jgi:hypothetical protein
VQDLNGSSYTYVAGSLIRGRNEPSSAWGTAPLPATARKCAERDTTAICPPATAADVSVANGSMFRGWGSEVDGYEHAMLNAYRKTAAGEAGTDEIEQGSPCLARR